MKPPIENILDGRQITFDVLFILDFDKRIYEDR